MGEADLGLTSQGRQQTGRTDVEAAARVMRERVDELAAAVARGDRPELEGLLVKGSGNGSGDSQPGQPPLPRVLAAVAASAVSAAGPAVEGWAEEADLPSDEGIRLVLVATRQARGHALDTAVAAQAMRAAIERFPDLFGVAVQGTDVAVVRHFCEAGIIETIGPLLADSVHPGDSGAATWGSGATSLALASATALVGAGLPWVFVDVPLAGPARVVNPLLNLKADPVVALLVRWRMFGSLADLASGDRPPIQLDEAQQAVVQRLARRWEQAHQSGTADALRGLVADALVRGDGTAGFAVRRYIEARYHELLAGEPAPVDLLAWAVERGSGRLLGQRLESLHKAAADGALPGGAPERDSTRWLLGSSVKHLNEIGKYSSHELRAVPPGLARLVAASPALTPEKDADAEALASVGLPPAPAMPGLTVFATWVVGAHPRDGVPTIGAQVIAEGLGALIRDHLGVLGKVAGRGGRGGGPARRVVNLRVLLLATPQSAAAAELQRRELATPPWPELFDRVGADVAVLPLDLAEAEAEIRVEEAVAQQLGSVARASRAGMALGAVMVVPTGPKQLALPLVRAVRREGARQGVPMFLRELTSANETGPTMHLWPALVDGDLPLLVAAREAVFGLELDVAWRLLSATSTAGSLAVRCRQLRNAFVCDEVEEPGTWPPTLPAPVPDSLERTVGLLGERLRLVHSALADAERGTPRAATRARYLMLAAATVEATVGRVRPRRDGGAAFDRLRDALIEMAATTPGTPRDAVLPLLILDAARNDLPITHGKAADPDTAVRAAAMTIATGTAGASPTPHARLTNVPALIGTAATSADQLFTPAPGAPGILNNLFTELWSDLNHEIGERESRRTTTL